MKTSRLSAIFLALGLVATGCADGTSGIDTTSYTHPGTGGGFPTTTDPGTASGTGASGTGASGTGASGTGASGTGASGTGAGGTGGATTSTTTTTDTTTTTTTTTTTDTGTGGSGGGQPQCTDADKRCDHLFTYPAGSESTVAVHGDFDGWGPGVSMTKNGATWEATVPLPWNAPVLYKFVINGTTWLPDPSNPSQVDDGYGGKNSQLAAATCATWTCVSSPVIPSAFDWRDAVMYFVFVDRFANGNTANDGSATPNVAQPADYQGGDWAGVKQKVDANYFSDLGVNVLWLSVPVDNTEASGLGTDGHLYSAYHGYWPKNLDQPESRFGTMAELQALVAAAHAKGIKVILDYAMNHVHSSSPLFSQHPDWFWPKDVNGQSCICGSSACPWDGNMAKRCWFTDYLPDFDFTNPAARQHSVDNAIWWIQQTGIDGFRLDAVKHIEDQWLYDLRTRVTTDIEPTSQQHFYMVGETYTGDSNLIKYYVKPSMLDGQFDFPMRARLIRSLLLRGGGGSDVMSALDGYLAYNDTFYGGSAVMSTFIGNHDVPRSIHFAEDNPPWGNEWADGKDRAWGNQPGQPGGAAPYERLANAFTLLYTSRGIPLVYYGDEVGMAGAGDPDNRRFMQWTGYSTGQTALYGHLKKLGASRAAHVALRRGTRASVSSTAETLVYKMTQGSDVVYVAINRADSAQAVTGLPAGQLHDELSGATLTGPSFSVPARSSMILVP